METFTDRFINGIKEKGSILCVGLDPQFDRLPKHLTKGVKESRAADIKLLFNKAIIDAVKNYAVAVKPNTAFYEGHGYRGIRALERTIEYAKSAGLLVILDAKRGDGGDAAEAYAEAYLGQDAFIDIDAMTINGCTGNAGVLPFVIAAGKTGKGIFVVTKTSFKQNPRSVENLVTQNGNKVWEEIAKMAEEWGRGTKGKYGYSNVGVVMGATYPEDAIRMRKILPNAMFLVPGYGAQGGGADDAVRSVNKDGHGCIVNSSRNIIYAFEKGPFQRDNKDFAIAAEKAAMLSRDELNSALMSAGKISWQC